MSSDEKVLLEALFYIFLILSAPFVYWVVSNVWAIIFARLVTVKSIKIEIENEHGEVQIISVDPKNDEALFNAIVLANRKKQRSGSTKEIRENKSVYN